MAQDMRTNTYIMKIITTRFLSCRPKGVGLGKLAAIALAALSSGLLSAHATSLSFGFSFEDANGLVSGEALLEATALSDNSGGFMATAGTLVLTAPAADGIAGTYQLFANPAGANALTSPTGLFIYDDLILPGANPIVTN